VRRESPWGADAPYSALLPSLFQLNAGFFLMQNKSERDRESVYKLVGQRSREDANGVAQIVHVGVINPQNPRVETPEEVRDELVAAARYIPKERLGSTDDCGFSPFSIDQKPLHGSPDFARDVAFEKIANRVQGTKMAAEKLGIQAPVAAWLLTGRASRRALAPRPCCGPPSDLWPGYSRAALAASGRAYSLPARRRSWRLRAGSSPCRLLAKCARATSPNSSTRPSTWAPARSS
jgi:Cobalamin-independent synthase, Catalytic domain